MILKVRIPSSAAGTGKDPLSGGSLKPAQAGLWHGTGLILVLALLLSPLALPAADAPAPAPVPAPAPAAPTAPAAPAMVATPDEQFRLAEGLLSRNFYDLARQELNKFLEKYPDHALASQATLRLIEISRTEGKPEPTLALIRDFRARWPQHEKLSDLVLLQGDLYLRQGNFAEAEKCFKEISTSQVPKLREAGLYFLGQMYARLGKLDETIAAFTTVAGESLTEGSPYRAYALFGLAVVRQQKGDFPGAAAAYQQLVNEKTVPAPLQEEGLFRLGELAALRLDYRQAADFYEKTIVDFPSGTFIREAWKRRIWAAFSLNDYATALEMAGGWEKKFGEPPDPEVLYLQGVGLAGSNRWEEALNLFRHLLTQPVLSEEYRRLSRYQEIFCLFRLERYPEVIPAVTAFLRDYPQSAEKPDLLFFSGESSFQTGALADASAALRQALDAFAGNWSYLNPAAQRLSFCLVKENKLAEAAAIYRKLSRQTTVENRAHCLLRAGELERQAGNSGAASADFEALRKEFPQAQAEVMAAMLNLAEVYAETGQYDPAAKIIQELIGQTPSQSQDRVLMFSGFLLFLQQKYAEAEPVLRQAAALTGAKAQTAATARFYLAGTLLELKRDAEAMDLFAALLDLPDDLRPTFSDPLLFRLEKLFFNRNRDAVSEKICRMLLARPGDPADRAKLRLAQILQSRNQVPEARQLLTDLILQLETRGADVTPGRLEEARSQLGENYLLEGLTDQAVTAFQQSLAKPGAGDEAAARARWGLARIFQKEARASQALHYAVSAFVLNDDPYYSPRAMILAIGLLAEQKKNGEAVTTWKELQQRFPAFAEAQKQDPVILQLGTSAAEVNPPIVQPRAN